MKIKVILLIFAAVVLGLLDGDCTAAVVMALLLLPGAFGEKRKKPARIKPYKLITLLKLLTTL